MFELPTVETPANVMASTFRILIMDTKPHVNLLKDACKLAGHEVVAAHTLEEAFAFLNTVDHADVIICAAYLEDEPMFEFLKRVKVTPIHKQTTIAILALEPGVSGARTNKSVARAARLLGADAFINMPTFDAEQLISEIHKLLPCSPSIDLDYNLAAQGNQELGGVPVL